MQTLNKLWVFFQVVARQDLKPCGFEKSHHKAIREVIPKEGAVASKTEVHRVRSAGQRERECDRLATC